MTRPLRQQSTQRSVARLSGRTRNLERRVIPRSEAENGQGQSVFLDGEFLGSFPADTDTPIDWNNCNLSASHGTAPDMVGLTGGSDPLLAVYEDDWYKIDATTSPAYSPITVKQPGVYWVDAGFFMGSVAIDPELNLGLKFNGGSPYGGLTTAFGFANELLHTPYAAFGWGDGAPPPWGQPAMREGSIRFAAGTDGIVGLLIRHTNTADPSSPSAEAFLQITRLFGPAS